MHEGTANAEPGDFAKMAALIREIRVGLLTTISRDGQLHTGPVQTLQIDEDQTLWFFTDWSSPKADELRHDVRVSLAYANPAKNVYIAVSGMGAVFQDHEKAKQLWAIEQRAFYPDGPGDKRLALLHVGIERAEYWIAPGPMSYLVSAMKAAVTGDPAAVIGENRKIK